MQLDNHLSIIPPVLGHRGASAYAPENTIDSFQKAFSMGAKWVEFDVMLSADGEAVVIHDETLDRTTNGKGKVIDYSFSYLKTLDAGSWFDPSFAAARIPSLREVIDFLVKHQMLANIEIKAQLGFEQQTVNTVLALLDAHWQKDLPAPLLSSFSLPTLEYLRESSSTCLLGFLMHDWLDDWETTCDRLNCISVNVNQEILDQEKVKMIKRTDRRLLSYTVNNAERARELFKLGVDAVFSDVPDKILNALK